MVSSQLWQKKLLILMAWFMVRPLIKILIIYLDLVGKNALEL